MSILQTTTSIIILALLTISFPPLTNGEDDGIGIKGTFQNPIKDETWPDPFCYLHSDGFYYMPRKENVSVALYKSPILHNWRNAEKAIIYTAPDGLLNLWAPEIFYNNGSWYIYFALDNGDNANHRMYVIKSVSSDPMQEIFWTREKRMIVPDEDMWAIDGTLLEMGGKLYFVWSGWPKVDAGFPQNLYIARMSDPETIVGLRVLINEPFFDWQMHGEPLLEGPQILKKANRVYIVYSCSGSWTPDYQLGIMGINDNLDPLVSTNWWKYWEPVFTRNDNESVYGVGHASFTTSKDGSESWIVYHAMSQPEGGWPNRTARIQKFEWDSDNFPIFPKAAGFETILETPAGED